MTTTDQAVRAAGRLARTAAATSAGVDACPYPATATGTQAAARREWLTTYLRVRPPAPGVVSLGNDLLALSQGPDTADDQAPVTAVDNLFAALSGTAVTADA